MFQLRPRHLAVWILAVLAVPAGAQSFNSGSNGSDGALDFSAVPVGTTVDFDPASFNPILDPDHDNVYHFTSIRIPAGVTVRLGADRLGVAPVVWLASGAVEIAGTLDLSGGNGSLGTGTQLPSAAGAGGYGGGTGGTPTRVFQPGNGPGGGRNTADGAGHVVRGGGSSGNTTGGATYGNDFLIPLLGGSGGAGGQYDGAGHNGSGGGAGGGAILIASSTSITVNGSILANGGTGGCASFYVYQGGGGSGGAIRLMAPLLQGTGTLNALGGYSCSFDQNSTPGSYGRIRLEAFQQRLTGGIQPVPAAVTPGSVFPPANAPSVRVVRVAGVAVPAAPTGSFVNPDVTLNGVAAATLDIEARKIPLGTVVKLTLTPETGSAVTVNATPLAGTLDLSTATATVTIPSGFSRFTVQATWAP